MVPVVGAEGGGEAAFAALEREVQRLQQHLLVVGPPARPELPGPFVAAQQPPEVIPGEQAEYHEYYDAGESPEEPSAQEVEHRHRHGVDYQRTDDAPDAVAAEVEVQQQREHYRPVDQEACALRGGVQQRLAYHGQRHDSDVQQHEQTACRYEDVLQQTQPEYRVAAFLALDRVAGLDVAGVLTVAGVVLAERLHVLAGQLLVGVFRLEVGVRVLLVPDGQPGVEPA